MKLPSLLLISLAVLGTAAAQQVSDPQVMAEARSFRKDLAADIEAGRVLPEAALAKLKQRRSFFGAGLDTETDQTMAAEDIGQRLLTSAKPETAITFFRAAEGLLGVVIDRTTDAASKARLLINRARIGQRQ